MLVRVGTGSLGKYLVLQKLWETICVALRLTVKSGVPVACANYYKETFANMFETRAEGSKAVTICVGPRMLLSVNQLSKEFSYVSESSVISVWSKLPQWRKNIKDGFEWGMDYIGLDSEERKSVVFSDKKSKLDSPDGWAYYWADIGKEENMFSRRKQSGGLDDMSLLFTLRKIRITLSGWSDRCPEV